MHKRLSTDYEINIKDLVDKINVHMHSNQSQVVD